MSGAMSFIGQHKGSSRSCAAAAVAPPSVLRSKPTAMRQYLWRGQRQPTAREPVTDLDDLRGRPACGVAQQLPVRRGAVVCSRRWPAQSGMRVVVHEREDLAFVRRVSSDSASRALAARDDGDDLRVRLADGEVIALKVSLSADVPDHLADLARRLVSR
jgi:hypothetical protein